MLITDHPADGSLAAKLAAVYQSAGRTREAVPFLATASAANPQDTLLSLKVAAIQAWFGQEQELAATRQRILAFAKGTSDALVAEQTAKMCSLLPFNDQAELEAALALGRTAVQLGPTGEWNLLALGLAEFRSGNYAAADKALLAAAEAGKNTRQVTGISAFFRAMCLFQQGQPDEARKLTVAAVAKMAHEKNPLEGNASSANEDDLILWMAANEAKALIKFDKTPALAAPDALGAFQLNAADATLTGTQIRYLLNGDEVCLGFWHKRGEWVSWNVQVDKPGTFDVSLDVSNPSGDSDFVVEIGDQKLNGKASQTTTWDDYQTRTAGRIEIKSPGVQTIHLRPKDPDTWKPMNLRVLRLTPTDLEGKPKRE